MFQLFKFLLVIGLGIAGCINSVYGDPTDQRTDLSYLPPDKTSESCVVSVQKVTGLRASATVSSPVIEAISTPGFPQGNDTEKIGPIPAEGVNIYTRKTITLGSYRLQTYSAHTQTQAHPQDAGRVETVSFAGAYLRVIDLRVPSNEVDDSFNVPLLLGYDEFQNTNGATFRRPHAVIAMSLSYSPAPRLLIVTTDNTLKGRLRIIDIPSLSALRPLAEHFWGILKDTSVVRRPFQIAAIGNESIEATFGTHVVRLLGIGNQVRSIHPTRAPDEFILVYDQYIALVRTHTNRDYAGSVIFDLQKRTPLTKRIFEAQPCGLFSDTCHITGISWKSNRTIVVEVSAFAQIPELVFEPLGLPSVGPIKSPELQSTLRFEVDLPSLPESQ